MVTYHFILFILKNKEIIFIKQKKVSLLKICFPTIPKNYILQSQVKTCP